MRETRTKGPTSVAIASANALRTRKSEETLPKGWSGTGTSQTSSQRPDQTTHAATMACPTWGGSKLPPYTATRIPTLSPVGYRVGHTGDDVRIGIFDSGIGGLTVLDAIQKALPGHDLVYLGDTARIPYGTRSPLTVQRYSFRVASWLYAQGVDALVIACNTATTHALDGLRAAGAEVGLPVFGVIEPGVQAALTATRGGGIAVLGTPGTIEGGAYQRALTARRPDLNVHGVACPLFVSLVEEGWLEGDVPRLVAEAYVGHLRGRIDTAILGCTHYPLLRKVLSEVLPGVTLVDSAQSTAHALRAAMGEASGRGAATFFATDNTDRFKRVSALFLASPAVSVSWVDLPEGTGPFREPDA